MELVPPLRPRHEANRQAGIIQRKSSTQRPMSGCGPNGRSSTQRRIEMAAVCQPDAASPLNAVFLAAASSKWNGCGSNSAANRLISSLVTKTSPLLKRIPNARSSNHSIISPSPLALGVPGVSQRPAEKLFANEIDRSPEVFCSGPAREEACERSLVVSPPFLLALAVSSPSAFSPSLAGSIRLPSLKATK